MLRYALIILGLIILVAYVVYMWTSGAITGTFKNISLILLAVLLLLVGTGLFYSQHFYSVQSVHEEFAANKQDIFKTIREKIEEKLYNEAANLAETYLEVNDPVLDRLYKQSREQDLLKSLEQVPESQHEKRLSLWRQLFELTGKEEYTGKIAAERLRLRKTREKAILNVLDNIPEAHLGQRALGFSLLEDLDPDNPTYHKKQNEYQLKIEELLQDTPWSDVCSRTSLSACQHFGYLALDPEVSQHKDQNSAFGEILGVSHRPKGALISKDGQVAPENGHYYIVHDFQEETIVLSHVDYLNLVNPYAKIR